MSRPSVRHTPAAYCLLVIALCLQLSYAVSESSTQAVPSRKVVSAGFTDRRLLQDAKMDVASSDEEVWEQSEGLTEVSSQSDKTDLPSEDLSEATTSAHQSDMDQSGGSEGQIAELEMGLSEDADIPEAESGNDDFDRVSLAEVEDENPFSIQSIEHGEDEESPSSDQQSTDQETFSPKHASSGSEGQSDKSEDDDLTFDEALAQAASSSDLSDESGDTDSSDSTADLTFAEAVAATKGTESLTDVIANKTRASRSDSDNPTAETPVLESLLPSVESVNDTVSAIKESDEPDTASSLNASSSSTSGNDESGSLVGTAAGAVGQKLSEAADSSESLLDEDTSSIQKVGGVLSGVRSWLNSSNAEEDADDEYTTTTSPLSVNQSVTSGAKASQLQEPLTDLEQLEPEEEEDLDFGNAGLTDAASTTGALKQQSSSSSNAAGSRPAYKSGQSRPAAQRPARPSAQGTAATAQANATDAATSQRAAAAELGTESGSALSAQTVGKAAGQSASSGRAGAADDSEYLDGELAELSEEYDQVVDPTSLTAQAQAQGRGSSTGKAVDAGHGAGSASERASQGSSSSSRPGLQAATSGQAGADFDDDYANEVAAGQAGRSSPTAAQLANSKAQQSLAASGFDDDAFMEDESLGGLQGSGTITGTQSIPNKQSGTSAKTGSQQSSLPSSRQGAVTENEADSLGGATSSQAGDWPRTGSSGTTPAGQSATGSSGRKGTTGGSSKQAGTSHQSGQTRDAQSNAFGSAGNAAASGLGSEHASAASAEDEETLMHPLGQTAATHSSQSNSARAGSRQQPGSGAHDLMDSKSAVSGLGSLADRGAASGQSWTALANQNRGATPGGASSSSRTGATGSTQSVNIRQQPLGDGEADIGDYDSRAFDSGSSTGGSGQSAYPRLVASDTLGTDSRSFAAGSKGGIAVGSRSGTALGGDMADSTSYGLGGAITKTTSGSGDDLADNRSFGGVSGSGSTTKSASGFGGNVADGSNSRVRSGFGDEAEEDSSTFMVGRDPTNPSAVVGAHQSFAGQPHGVQQRDSAANTGSTTVGGLPAGKTKMSLDADEDEEAPLLAGSQSASQALSKMNAADVDKSGSGSAGPVVTSSVDDEYVARPQAGGRQSSDASSTLHSLLDSVINNWVVITALSVFACTGAVLAFVFLRGFVPNPYEVITFSNVGTAGYAGNNGGYTGVTREDEENGWEHGWGDDDAQGLSPQQKRSSSNSPPRGTGVGKLKKGTFAKKKPANWSNDF
ncbi:hypothetical protein WJX79_000435 [Trebouxia sp. C0005]